jgi:hypothetical protein
MRKFFAVAALAGATIVSSMLVTTNEANAQFRRWGPWVGAGIAAGVVTGAIIANSEYRRCGWIRTFDRFGNYMGRQYVCN